MHNSNTCITLPEIKHPWDFRLIALYAVQDTSAMESLHLHMKEKGKDKNG